MHIGLERLEVEKPITMLFVATAELEMRVDGEYELTQREENGFECYKEDESKAK
jgi:hypothetical protein